MSSYAEHEPTGFLQSRRDSPVLMFLTVVPVGAVVEDTHSGQAACFKDRAAKNF
jgi:hypothetical protein